MFDADLQHAIDAAPGRLRDINHAALQRIKSNVVEHHCNRSGVSDRLGHRPMGRPAQADAGEGGARQLSGVGAEAHSVSRVDQSELTDVHADALARMIASA